MSNIITNRWTNSLTPYTGYVGFFFQFNLLPPLLASLAGGKASSCHKIFTFYYLNCLLSLKCHV